MKTSILLVACFSMIGCASMSPSKDPFVQVRENETKIHALGVEQDKSWDAIVDRVYATTNLEALENLNKEVDTVRDSSYFGYGKAKIAVLYQRTRLTYWTQK